MELRVMTKSPVLFLGRQAREVIIADLNERNGLNMPVEAVACKEGSLYYEQLPQLKAIPEVLEHIEASTAAFPSRWFQGSRRVGRWLADRARLARQIRHHRGSGRLQERQARPGCVPAWPPRRLGVAPKGLPGL
jgi:hypothetical protein